MKCKIQTPWFIPQLKENARLQEHGLWGTEKCRCQTIATCSGSHLLKREKCISVTIFCVWWRRRASEVSLSPLSRGRGEKKSLGIFGTLQNSASCTFNWKATNRSSTQKHLYLAVGGFASLMWFMMGGVFSQGWCLTKHHHSQGIR